MTSKFATAALAAVIGTAFVAPAFAADPVAPAGSAVTQPAPKAKHEAQKADGKAKHDQTAKHKADGAKVDKTAPAKKIDKTL